MIQAIITYIRQMPRPAYLMLRAALAICCIMLMCALTLYFMIEEFGIHTAGSLDWQRSLRKIPPGFYSSAG